MVYIWQEEESEDVWGTIAAVFPALGTTPAPLVFRDATLANRVEGIARAHGRARRRTVRLARFQMIDVVREVLP